MTEFDRRDFVRVFTAMMVTGIITKPDDARAGGDGGGAASRLLWALFVATIAITLIYVIILQHAFAGSVQSAKVLEDRSRTGKPSTKQRLKTAKKIGTVRMRGDLLIAVVLQRYAAALIASRSLSIFIPILGTAQVMEMTLRRQNARKAQQIIAMATGGRVVGSLFLDPLGLIVNLKQAKLGQVKKAE